MAVVETDFAEWLRDQLETRGWGIRRLAREINPKNPEVPRRAINHYMRGSRPTEPYAEAIAKAFNLDRSEVPVKEDARLGGPFRGRPDDGADSSGGKRGSTRARPGREVTEAA